MQIENEYGKQSKLLGADGYNYMSWAAKMAVETGTGVPWVMCKEDDAPDPVVCTFHSPVSLLQVEELDLSLFHFQLFAFLFGASIC